MSTFSREPGLPGSLERRQAARVLASATAGFAICFWAWSLIGPLGPAYAEELGLTPFEQALLVALPVVVGSVGRIPAGALTDRFGARRVFPALAGLTVLPVLFVGFAGTSYPALLAGGFLLGIGGTVFAVGVPLVSSWFPPKRRGLALGVFGMGTVGTAISAFTTAQLAETFGRPAPFVAVAAVLLVYVAVASRSLRDVPGRPPATGSRAGSVAARTWETLTRPVTLRLSWLYALAFGGFVAFSVYLPTYLANAYGLGRGEAALRTAGFIVLAVLARPAGGRLSDRFAPVPVLTACFLAGAGLAALAAFELELLPAGTLALLGLAVVLGAASGATFALVAELVPAGQVGAVSGVVGAAGGLGGFLPPLLMGAIYGSTGEYTLGLALLAVLSLATGLFTWYGVRAPRQGSERRPGPEVAGGSISGSVSTTVRSRSVVGGAPGHMAEENGAGMDDEITEALLRTRRFFQKAKVSKDLRSLYQIGGRDADGFYRDRWSHDKVVRSTHGVNCTGSCSWKVYVRDGIITWESQQTDYPSVGDDRPAYEPRGCPRGAAFSWYTYSPTRIRYPYVRGSLLRMYREARQRLGDPVAAWASIVTDPVKARAYKSVRGKGGLVRAGWDEALEMVAAAHVHTIRTAGPDRVAGFSPIPAMSMVSHAVGSRFISLIGGAMLSFYDWYADLPVASPQVFGDQTDVPESADWWDAGYLVMWGSNVPVTRTPDAHYMTEARYRGQKVVVVSPDYADNTKFADEWLAPHPGTDGALAMAMGHVILKEFFVERTTPAFERYCKRYTDLPFLVTLEPRGDAYVPAKFLTADAIGDASENAAVKTVLLNGSGVPVVPNGSLGFRYGDAGMGRWNLDLGDIDPLLSAEAPGDPEQRRVPLLLPRFDALDGRGGLNGNAGGGAGDGEGVLRRGVPVREVGGRLVTTVFDLLLAQYGVHRDGLPGEWPSGYDEPAPYTPAWQEKHTSVPAAKAIRIAREFARNAEESGGRSMILMGAGTNHWFHSDQIYRSFLTLVMLTGCEGVNGGGWAHYVGQEKVRPLTGHQVLANALDWARPPRQMISTAFFYLHTSQWRYDRYPADILSSPLGGGRFAGTMTADLLAQSARLGWMPAYPTFDRNPLDLADDAERAGMAPSAYVVQQLEAGRLRFAAEDPDGPGNAPKVLTVWRSNLLGSSAKGNEYFLRYLLGADSAIQSDEAPPEFRPRDVRWREAPDGGPGEGKLDLLTTLDFRMTSTTLFSDVVLPAATWYEKYDLSSTDMHPFVHSFNPAIAPPWQTRTDFDAFHGLAKVFSRLADRHLGTRRDIVAMPLAHDTPDEMRNPGGVVRDWKAGEHAPVPGENLPKLIVVERDYPAVADQMAALGPLVDTLGMTTKGVTYTPDREVEWLAAHNGRVRGGTAAGRPSLARDIEACEAVLALSGTTNGRLATQGFHRLEGRTGRRLADLSADQSGARISFADAQAHPQAVITSPEWSGSEHGGRRYAPFVINTERLKPWHTLTGRMHFFLDHDWMHETGEALPIYRPPLAMAQLFGEPELGLSPVGRDGSGNGSGNGSGSRTGNGAGNGRELVVRYLTPHSKWSIHSEYQDNLLMLSLSRGGPTIWMSHQDAAVIGVRDNEWIEAVNRNGVVVARAIVSTRMPTGTVFMYHAQDRVIDVPLTETSGKRGGIHNSVTRLLIKPSHLIGGYAQFAYAFNYIGPTGNQRDEVTVIRRRSQEVVYA